jgi:putative transposase
MLRRARSIVGGLVYHILNRANSRLTLFRKAADYEAFERVLEEACERFSLPVLTYCVMPNHWHFLVWPPVGQDRLVSEFFRWLTVTHTQRWHAHQHTSGTGHLYQGRFKAFPIQEDEHFLTVARYVERNPLRANLVERAEDWRFGGLARRAKGGIPRKLLAAWPVPSPRLWTDHVNQAQTDAEESAIRLSIRRGTPFGSAEWRDAKVAELGLESTLRSPGQPRKAIPET